MTQHNDEMKYWAFISYRHTDNNSNNRLGNRWADWLHNELEKYRIPKGLVGKEGRNEQIPDRIFPVFQDEKELPTNSDLQEMVRVALKQSRYLIVICSPRAVESRYINEEIRYFKSLGRGNKILPLIIDGEPNADSDYNQLQGAEECFPMALRQKVGADGQFLPDEQDAEPICADARGEDGGEIRIKDRNNALLLEKAKLKIIAGILGVNYDDLFQRDKARQLAEARARQRRWALLSIAFFLLAVAAVFGFYKADQRKNEAELTLAEANFEEASRLLDDKNDMPKALAYLGESLKNVVFTPANQRLYGLLLHRSWLINRESVEFDIKNQDWRVVSPKLSHMAKPFLPIGDGKSFVKICPVFKSQSLQEIDIETQSIPKEFTENGHVLVTSKMEKDRQHFYLWRVDDGSAIGNIKIEKSQKLCAISPTGKFVLIHHEENETLIVVNTESGEKIDTLKLEPGRCWNTKNNKSPIVAFDNDGQYLAIVDKSNEEINDSSRLTPFSDALSKNESSFRLQVYRLDGWEKVMDDEFKGEIEELCYSAGTDYLLYTTKKDPGKGFSIWGLPLNEKCLKWQQNLPSSVWNLVTSPDGVLVCVVMKPNSDNQETVIQVRNVFDGGELKWSSVLDKGIQEITFSHDGRRLAVVTKEPEVRIFNATDGREIVERRHLREDCTGLAFTRDDGVLIVGAKNRVNSYAIQVSPLAPQHIETESKFLFETVAASPDGNYLAVGGTTVDNGVVEFYSSSGKLLSNPLFTDEGNGGVNSIDFSLDGTLLAVGVGKLDITTSKGMLYLLDTKQVRENSSQNIPNGQIDQGGDKYQKTDLKKIQAISFPLPVQNVKILPEADKVMIQYFSKHPNAKQVDIYDITSKSLDRPFIIHDNAIQDVCIGPDGCTIVTVGSDRILKIWDLKTKQRIGDIVQFDEFPESVDFSSDGTEIVVGSRVLNIKGTVRLLSISGESLWEEPLHFSSGVYSVCFSPNGQAVAIALGNNEIRIYDTQTGQPKTQPLEHDYPIVKMQFLESRGSTILCTTCGRFKQGGYVEFWDIDTGRRVGDRIGYGNVIMGIELLGSDSLVSWTRQEAVISENPINIILHDQGESIDFKKLTGRLGGLQLNAWRAPEAVQNQRIVANEIVTENSVWLELLEWLNTPAHSRSITPNSQLGIISRLNDLSNGSSHDIQSVLDVIPDFSRAISEYWYYAAQDAAEKNYLAKAQNATYIEQRHLQEQWNSLSNIENFALVFSDPEAVQLADFWTKESCNKQPQSILSWKSRAIYLRHVNDNHGAMDAIQKALIIDPKDIESRNQLALIYLEEKNLPAALKELDILREQISEMPSPSFKDVYYVGFLRIEQGAILNGFKDLANNSLWLIEQLERSWQTQDTLSSLEAKYIIELSGKLTQLLLRFNSGSEIAEQINIELLELVKSKKVPTMDRAKDIEASLLCALSQSHLLQRKGDIVLSELEKVDVGDNLGVYINVLTNQAHALYLSGSIDDAINIYNQLMEQTYLGKELFLLSIYQDFSMFKGNGFDLEKLQSVQSRLEEILSPILTRGVRVTRVSPDSQADRIGIQKGDRIVAYNKEPIISIEDFSWQLQRSPYVESLELAEIVVLRDGKEIKYAIEPGSLGVSLTQFDTE